jgi:predicted secreted protein
MAKIFSLLLLFPAICMAETSLTLEANARSEVPNDEMVVNVAVEKTGPDVGPLNKAVLESLKSIVSEVKTVAGVNSRIGNIMTHPNYVKNVQQGWTVRGDVIIDSSDMEGLRHLSGKLAKEYQIAGISYRLSESLRLKEESTLISQAAKNFKKKLAEATSAFGYNAYEIKQVTLGQPGSYRPVYPTASMATASSDQQFGIPKAPGHTEVVVTVSGVAVMK